MSVREPWGSVGGWCHIGVETGGLSKCEGMRGGARCSHASSRYVGKELSSELIAIWGRGVLSVLCFVSIVLLW